MAQHKIPVLGTGGPTKLVGFNSADAIVPADVKDLTEKTTPVGDDLLILQDSTDNSYKKAKVSNVGGEHTAMKYSGAAQTDVAVTGSWQDIDLSSVVGEGKRAMVTLGLTGSATSNVLFRTKGDTYEPFTVSATSAGYGSSGVTVAASNIGGYIMVVTDESGVIEVKGGQNTTISWKVVAYQVLE